MSLRDELRLPGTEGFTLSAIATDATPQAPKKKKAKKALESDLADELFDLHEMMMAAEDHALLLVLQGTDASGKGGHGQARGAEGQPGRDQSCRICRA